MKLWSGQTISQLGSTITRDALPLIAVITLKADPAQIGILGAMGAAPAILFGVFAGVWVDRLRRKPLLIAADLGRALLLSLIPIAALGGWLRVEHLFLAAFLAGSLSMVFDIAYPAYLPTLLRRDQLVEGNSKLGASDAIAEVGGSALGGSLVQWITAPLTILVDAVSFLFSALFLALIRAPEPPLSPPAQRMHIWAEIVDGARAITARPALRALGGVAATVNFFGGFFGALYSLFAIRELGVTPAVLGILIASGGVGSLLGSLLNEQALRKFGLGRLLIVSLLLTSLLGWLTPLASGTALAIFSMLLAGQVFGDMAHTVFSITALSLQQAVTPISLLGRVNAFMQFGVGGLGMLGLFIGGLAGQFLGARATLFIAVIGRLFCILWLLASPIRHLQALPEVIEE